MVCFLVLQLFQNCSLDESGLLGPPGSIQKKKKFELFYPMSIHVLQSRSEVHTFKFSDNECKEAWIMHESYTVYYHFKHHHHHHHATNIKNITTLIIPV